MITQSTRAQDAPGNAALRAMFAARKQVFIDKLQWDLPALDGRFELDQFDTPDARYLILLDPDDLRHRASARLLPTTAPHLLGDIYSHLCADGAPSGEGVWEISRFCLDPGQTPTERRDARNQLVTALADYALRHGIGEYVGVAEAGWYHTISKFGWTCRTLGPVHRDSACRIVALSIAIDEDTLPGLQRTGTYAPLVLKFEEGGEAGR
ncbi:autoinducer synthase [Sphingopyxis sp. H038]|jgi:N-acyl-L-homoserine lactone synthetase|uniref:acyl-homoserine-lactone synthase n=1 Tax=unclassified Sphingopyxis TaxID=2614943 RepID=UPI00050F7D9A|nr:MULTISPECIES: acyl-homoserine-lactone synthase [unclassified Sphingopyxis]MBN8842731.1 autoinducer synthase [Sphingomonadales bacterium]KGB55896.1 Autoinducer synthesis protein [Sphingopyxis sp. LC363]KTD99573.1 autoinducer synthase [Sphingopyxis sp. H012]KTE05239.1 autoinducer synthase [Sphingopyxis sp. H093]KTE09385.1 autoinducer synthase [Sphingopyxis sp. H053]